jgi:hypothetical protein
MLFLPSARLISPMCLVDCKVKQGAKLSPTLYKSYNNQLLDVLRDNNIGAQIGTMFIGCPTVADDIALTKVVMETVLPLSLASFIPPVVTTAAFIGDVFAVNPCCIGFCTLMHPHRRNTERSKKEERIPDITTTTTEQAIQKLAKGKAPDHMGLTAEHFKKGGKTIANYTAALCI